MPHGQDEKCILVFAVWLLLIQKNDATFIQCTLLKVSHLLVEYVTKPKLRRGSMPDTSMNLSGHHQSSIMRALVIHFPKQVMSDKMAIIAPC